MAVGNPQEETSTSNASNVDASVLNNIKASYEPSLNKDNFQLSDITPEQITSLIRNKKTQSQVAPELAAALEADADEKGGDPKYTFGLRKLIVELTPTPKSVTIDAVYEMLELILLIEYELDGV